MKSPCTAPWFPAKARFTSGPRGGAGGGVGGQGGGGRFLMDLSGSGLNSVPGRELRAESGALLPSRDCRKGGPDPVPALRSPGAGAPGSLPSRDRSVLHGEAHLAPLLLPTACFPLLPSTGSFAKLFWSGGFANSYLPLLLSSFI